MITEFYEEVKKRGIFYDNHCSDLYVYVTNYTTEIVKDYEYECNVTEFRNQIDGKMMYEIPFAYTDYYKKLENE